MVFRETVPCRTVNKVWYQLGARVQSLHRKFRTDGIFQVPK